MDRVTKGIVNNSPHSLLAHIGYNTQLACVASINDQPNTPIHEIWTHLPHHCAAVTVIIDSVATQHGIFHCDSQSQTTSVVYS